MTKTVDQSCSNRRKLQPAATQTDDAGNVAFCSIAVGARGLNTENLPIVLLFPETVAEFVQMFDALSNDDNPLPRSKRSSPNCLFQRPNAGFPKYNCPQSTFAERVGGRPARVQFHGFEPRNNLTRNWRVDSKRCIPKALWRRDYSSK